MLQEAIGTVVNRQAQHAHIVSVEDTVAEAIALPEGDHFRCAFHKLFVHEHCAHFFSFIIVSKL